jgi:hypothetical protein
MRLPILIVALQFLLPAPHSYRISCIVTRAEAPCCGAIDTGSEN